jgi:hypothetical protein
VKGTGSLKSDAAAFVAVCQSLAKCEVAGGNSSHDLLRMKEYLADYVRLELAVRCEL